MQLLGKLPRYLLSRPISLTLDSNTFMIAVGGITAVWLSAYMGRLPVAFWFQCFSAATAAWSAAAKSFESYMAARILNGFFAVSLAAGGLMWIKDLW